MSEILAAHDVALVRAPNPSPLTLDGTNTWLVGRDPCWVVDPGPALEGHLGAVLAEGRRRGGLAGVTLTHAHADHADGARALAEQAGGVVVAGPSGDVDRVLAAGNLVGPLEAIAVPGHTADHLAYAAGGACFTGDAVLGAGSVYVSGHLSAYLDALRELRRRRFAVLCPGHGPVVEDPEAVLDRYVEHRLDRERRLLAALEEGRRSVEDLLDAAWSDVPAALRHAAAVTLRAHLEKLEQEGRLPGGVEWPAQAG